MQSPWAVSGHEGPTSDEALADTVSGLVREFLDMLGSGEAWNMLLVARWGLALGGASAAGAINGRLGSLACPNKMENGVVS